ncbi:MAG: DUF418 domain-containing protein [Fimbriimonadaceae bacterium]|nr:DUF418 domain-containing protein [Fimbriimonadaceae bacterium]
MGIMQTPELRPPVVFDYGNEAPTEPLLPKDTPIEPAVRERFASLDLARGVAILGILLANIGAFATAAMTEMTASAPEPTVGIDRLFEMLSLAFVNGKFRAMLAILFGAGLYMQYAKRSKIEGNWPGGYLKRTLYLLLIGLVHGYLIWYGDILAAYAGISFGVCLLAAISDRARQIAIWVSAGLSVLAGLFIVAMTALMNVLMSKESGALFAGDEAKIFTLGSYLDQLEFRGIVYSYSLAQIIILAPVLTLLFLIGFELSKQGLFSEPEQNGATLKKMAGFGLGLGLPLSMLVWIGWNLKDTRTLLMFPEFLTGPLLAVGYLSVVVAWSRTKFLAPIQKLIGNVGRLALTNYLLQSLICTTLFYSWGFGLFGKLDSVGMLSVVLAVWVVNIAFSAIYLRFFRIGPMEWIWRCLTEGRRMPIRKAENPA